MAHALARSPGSSAWPAPQAACYHCGLPVPEGTDIGVTILGYRRGLCCPGCEAVARTILEAGFESYYETRDLPRADEPRVRDLLSSAIYDDALAQRQFVATAGEHGREALLALEGIRCTACVWLNERFLRRVPGVTGISVNYATPRAQVAWDERKNSLGGIIDAVCSLG